LSARRAAGSGWAPSQVQGRNAPFSSRPTCATARETKPRRAAGATGPKGGASEALWGAGREEGQVAERRVSGGSRRPPALAGKRRPPRRRASRRGDSAISTVIGFAMALLVYTAALAVWFSAQPDTSSTHSDASILDSRSLGGLDQILGDPGLSGASSAWLTDPDHLSRFGIADASKAGRLDLEKLRNLTKGSMSTNGSNGLLDYGEAKAALGLGKYDFHLRIYPILNSLADGSDLVKANVSYIGDFLQQQSTYANYPVENTSSSADGTPVGVSVTVTNNGTVATVFQVEFSAALTNGNLVDTANTRLLAPTESQTVNERLYKTTDWSWAGAKNVDVTISDRSKSVGHFAINLSSYTMTAGPNHGDAAVTADADRLLYKTNQKPTIYFNVWDGKGAVEKNVEINLTVRDVTTGSILRSWQGDTKKNGDSNKIAFDVLPAGYYRVEVYKVSDSSYNSTDYFLVTDDDIGDFTTDDTTPWTETAQSAYERSVVKSLVKDWSNTTYDVGGDVYPDLKKVMNNDLAANLTTGMYDVLVVGSGVDQNAMTSASAKYAVRDFVLNGGLLVALGSDAQQVNWLEPLFHSSLSTASDAVGVPDTTNPILHSPEELAYDTYDDHDHAWEFSRDEDASHFSHVIPVAGATYAQDILSVSKPGHYGNGTIILTSWEPYDLTHPQDFDEARKLLNNFFSFRLGALYVDFGPRIPDYAEVGSSSRVATAPDPTHAEGEVMVRTILYVFH